MLVAGGDLPDIISVLDPATSSSLMDSGALLALDELLEKYGQDITAKYPYGFENGPRMLRERVKHIFFPLRYKWVIMRILSSQTADCSFYSRYDVYKAIGSPAINGEVRFS